MDYDPAEAVTWVHLTDGWTGEEHMLEFDGDYSTADDDFIVSLILRDYSDMWPSKNDFIITEVELGAPDQ